MQYREQRNSSDSDAPVDPNEAWLRVAGTNRGNVYGLGSSQPLYYERSSKASGPGPSQMFEPSVLSQLEARNKALEEEQARTREALEEERARTMELTREFNDRFEREREERNRQFKDLRNMFLSSQNCNNMFSSPFQDPRDPGDGGGATGSFPVQPSIF